MLKSTPEVICVCFRGIDSLSLPPSISLFVSRCVSNLSLPCFTTAHLEKINPGNYRNFSSRLVPLTLSGSFTTAVPPAPPAPAAHFGRKPVVSSDAQHHL